VRRMLVLLAAASLGACASIVEGTSQTLTFESNPPGADCALVRIDQAIGRVTTPGGVLIQKTKHNINVTCRKEGYQDSTAFLKSEIAEGTFGNIILGGGIGWAIDSASGADNKYQAVTTITLVPILAGGAGLLPEAPSAPTVGQAPLSREQRLVELQRLREQNLITEDEYRAKRDGILREL
jgi:hypothetical protein